MPHHPSSTLEASESSLKKTTAAAYADSDELVSESRPFDALVVGGGIAGSTTATALAQGGRRVLVCESGLPDERRLAGELIQPGGVQALEQLGLIDAVRAAGSVPAYGFAIFRNARDPGTVLSFSEIPSCRPDGLALDHALLTRTLLKAASEQPGVVVWEGARVLEVEKEGSMSVATVQRDGATSTVRVPLVVSAQGRGSTLRNRAGIQVDRGEPFRMLGWMVSGGRLPYPGYGHLFVGGSATALAYQVGTDTVRVMFEVGRDDELRAPAELLDAIPQPFADDVRAVIETERPQTAKVYGLTPHHYRSGNTAIVGDAGGCVHPLTASGIAFCVMDAVLLAKCIKDGDLETGLSRYESARRAPMHTRTTLGAALVETLFDDEPAMRLLRHGLFRYWQRSPRGRRNSLGLLAVHHTQPALLVREYATVCAHALTGLTQGVVAPKEALPAVVQLARRAWAARPTLSLLRP